MTLKTTEVKKPSKARRERAGKRAGAVVATAAIVTDSDEASLQARVARHDDADAFIPDPESTHRRVPDDLAEYLGEGFVKAATSGDDLDPDENDAVQTEEIGGPFIETDAVTEFAGETEEADAGVSTSPSELSERSSSESEWEGPTLAEAFPTAIRADIDPVRNVDEARLAGAGSPEDEEDDEDEIAPARERDALTR